MIVLRLCKCPRKHHRQDAAAHIGIFYFIRNSSGPGGYYSQ
jgi:hypothetical protein